MKEEEEAVATTEGGGGDKYQSESSHGNGVDTKREYCMVRSRQRVLLFSRPQVTSLSSLFLQKQRSHMKNAHPSPLSMNSEVKNAPCLPGILRRFLCASISDDIVPIDNSESGNLGLEWKKTVQKKPSATPCIVARLMGLDSMSVFPYTPPESVEQSQFSNSVENCLGFPCAERNGAENEDFIVLSFGLEDKEERAKVDCKEAKIAIGDIKERRKETKKGRRINEHKKSQEKTALERKHSNGNGPMISFTKNDGVHEKSSRIYKCDSNIRPVKQKEMLISMAKTNSTMKTITSCNHQSMSPVSVLDYPLFDGEYIININSLNSGNAEHNSPKPDNSKSFSFKFDNLTSASSSFYLKTISRPRDMVFLQESSKRSSNICMLMVEELKNSTWISKEVWRSKEFSEVAAAVESEVLDLLLEETISENFTCNKIGFINHI
ncbi:hypothetical protein Cni_G13342 [Canna indica]|uniref:DUF3741 domain-containing protein n=1 Tax=Canna indica TaxID=4628 RepID=A0AAQ3QDM6_9LILI|nr:hypothetical protein Cni_G13342 [Canna indica]